MLIGNFCTFDIMNDNSITKLSLPSSSSKEDLETISRNKFAILFAPELFELRPEAQRDKGIDIIIEIKQDGKFTNFRFAVQLKSTASTKLNKDGSISVPIKVSNINYLLNYGMPTYYILYEYNSGNFYLEHPSHVYQNLIKKYAPLKLPENFKVKFSKLFTPELIKEIYQQAFDYGTLLWRLKAHKFPVPATKGIVIDEENEVYSIEQNIAFINQYGFKLLNDKQYDQIIEIEQRTHPRLEASSMFNLVCGVAYFQRANLFKALELLIAAQKKATDFSPDLQSMLTYHILNGKYLLGMMDEQALKQGLNKLMDANNFGSFLQVEKAYNIFLETGEIQILTKKLHELIKVEKDNYDLRVMAYGKIIQAESKILMNDFEKNSLFICGRVKELLKTKTYKQWEKLSDSFEKRMDSLIKFAVSKTDFLGASNVWSSKVEWNYCKVFMRHLLKNWNKTGFNLNKELGKEDLEVLLKCSKDLDKIAKTYEKLQHKENFVLCLIAKYELLHFIGNKKEANDVEKEITKIIDGAEMNGLKSKLNKLINGGTTHEKFIKSFSARMQNVQSIAKSEGISDEHLYGNIPEELLQYTESHVRWSLNDFYEFDFS